MEIRGKLRSDMTNGEAFAERWFTMSENRRQDSHDIGDYLLIDDFSVVRKRNAYLSTALSIDEKELSNINKTRLEAAEKILKDVDWNKYR